ncbi:hypothetical protein [Marinitoga lauensis]|uniref:hypothetical protein n=1 Tax=Marinitoga lauensis TaxID=2201189 RepID=UPI00140538AA|nr:hypothetical protein [Marinitoga lauensis]
MPNKNDTINMVEFYERVLENNKTLATQLNEFDKTTKDFEKLLIFQKVYLD